MRVFVLCTGRCGSETFARACGHMSNFSAAHESQAPWHKGSLCNYESLDYPDNHIEVDNRLSWFTGRLDHTHGDKAFYVHLLRDREETASSLARRGTQSILYAYSTGILQHYEQANMADEKHRHRVALHYWDTVNSNIELFLRDKTRVMTMWLHDIRDPFAEFWQAIGAVGDLDAALNEWDVQHNSSKKDQPGSWDPLKQVYWQEQLAALRRDLMTYTRPGSGIVLADQDLLRGDLALEQRHCTPFIELDGQYGGVPEDDSHAISEMVRLAGAGNRYLAIAWPAFWWLEYYPGFFRYLRDTFKEVLKNDRVILYETGQKPHSH